MLSIVVAYDQRQLIGADGTLPWHLPADLKHFRAITMGKPIVMGRRTHESIGRPLPGRTNIVVSSDRGYRSAGCIVANDLDAALTAAREFADEVMVIGGSTLYAAALPGAGRIYLTEVHGAFEGDVYFPAYDKSLWSEVERSDHAADVANPYSYSFVVMDRFIGWPDHPATRGIV